MRVWEKDVVCIVCGEVTPSFSDPKPVCSGCTLRSRETSGLCAWDNIPDDYEESNYNDNSAKVYEDGVI